MRKIFVQMSLSLDGFFEGPNREIDWHLVDDEFNQFAIEMLRGTDTLLFGRVCYQLFEDYWPAAEKDPATSKNDLEVARLINNMNKVVFSRTLQKVEWKNSRLVKELGPTEILKMKQQPGKDMSVGGADLISAFAKAGLIDEYRLIMTPVVLGKGKPLFKNVEERMKLKLVKTRTFKSGNVLLHYEPISK